MICVRTERQRDRGTDRETERDRKRQIETERFRETQIDQIWIGSSKVHQVPPIIIKHHRPSMPLSSL